MNNNKKSKTPHKHISDNITMNNYNQNEKINNSYNLNSYNAPGDKNYFSNPGRNSQMEMNMNNNMMPNLDFTSDDTGESIRVCIRVRPMNVQELGRGDSKCVEFLDNSTLLFKNK